MTLARSLTLALLTISLLHADDPNEDLRAAARKGDAAQVKLLLDRGADVNAKSAYGSTPLFFASDRGHMDVIKLLIERGADLNAEDSFYHFTPLSWAVQKNRPEVVKLLLDRGAKSPAQVLTAAVQGGNAELAKIALDASKDKGKIDGATLSSALAMATRENKSELVDILKAAGAEPLKTVKLDESILQSYAGSYNGGRGGTEFEFTFTVKGENLSGTLVGQGELTYAPSDRTHFHSVEFPGTNIEFLSGDAFRIIQGGTQIDFKRKAVAK